MLKRVTDGDFYLKISRRSDVCGTVSSEDSPSNGTFTYHLKGFNVPPTAILVDWRATGLCRVTVLAARVHAGSSSSFHGMLRAYKNPKFAFTLLSGWFPFLLPRLS